MPFWKRRAETDAEMGIRRLNWQEKSPEEMLVEAYDDAVGFAQEKIKFYFRESERAGRWAKGVRYGAISLAAFAALMPLLKLTGSFDGYELVAWGYVALAAAAGLASFDRFGGWTWIWTRDTVIWVTLRAELSDFQHAWLRLMSTSERPEQKLLAVATFRSKVEQAVQAECQKWADGVAEQGKQLLAQLTRLHGQELKWERDKRPVPSSGLTPST